MRGQVPTESQSNQPNRIKGVGSENGFMEHNDDDDSITTVVEIDSRGRITLQETIRRWFGIELEEGEKELLKITIEDANRSEP